MLLLSSESAVASLVALRLAQKSHPPPRLLRTRRTLNGRRGKAILIRKTSKIEIRCSWLLSVSQKARAQQLLRGPS